MRTIGKYLRGKKTNLIAFAAAVYAAGIAQSLWPHLPWVDVLLAAFGTAALRAGIAKSGPESGTKS